jgi:hypothetical protein
MLLAAKDAGMPACWLPMKHACQPDGCQRGMHASLLAAKEAGRPACWLPRMQACQPADWESILINTDCCSNEIQQQEPCRLAHNKVYQHAAGNVHEQSLDAHIRFRYACMYATQAASAHAILQDASACSHQSIAWSL